MSDFAIFCICGTLIWLGLMTLVGWTAYLMIKAEQ